MPQRAVFFGTPDWAVPSLERLSASDIEVAGVVTNPDRPAGRGYEMQASPVKAAAEKEGLPVWQPEKARDPELMERLQELQPDVCVVVAYGKILPAALLEVPRRGFVNVHFSLLPAYRGAAPVQRAVMDGLSETGVSIMVLTEGMDEGPVLAGRPEPIGPEDTAGTVGERLAVVGADLLVPTLDAYLSGELEPVAQEHEAATYAPKLSTDEARIEWTEPAVTIASKIRGLQPAPGAWTMLGDARLKIHKAVPVEGEHLAAGSLRTDPEALVAGTGDGNLAILEAQLAGKKKMSGLEIARGLRPTSDLRLGG